LGLGNMSNMLRRTLLNTKSTSDVKLKHVFHLQLYKEQLLYTLHEVRIKEIH